MQDQWTSLEKPSAASETSVEASPYEPPQASLADTGNTAPREKSYQEALAVIAMMGVFSFVTGIGDGLLTHGDLYQAYHFTTVLGFGFLTIFWYRKDCHFLGRTPSTGMAVAILLIGVIAIPVHLFRSRGAGKGTLGTLLFAGFFVLSVVLSALGAILVVGWDEFFAMT